MCEAFGKGFIVEARVAMHVYILVYVCATVVFSEANIVTNT